jgi:predicted permease
MTAVALILLLSCANVAGLMLARSSARQKEISVRSALGAARLRIIQQLLTESLLLSGAGGALGILLAKVGVKSLVAFLSFNSNLPLQLDVGMDRHVLSFTLAVCIIVGILFGIAPALRSSRVDVTPGLKLGGGQAGASSRQSSRLHGILVASQVAISILVLVGAGLLGRTVLNLETDDPGFNTRNLLLFQVDTTASGLAVDDPRCNKLNQELQSRLAALPGVSSVGYSMMPLVSGGILGGAYRKPSAPLSSVTELDTLPVGPSFFETLQIPLIAGRTFTRTDFETTAKPKPMVINRSFARSLFGNANPLGQVLAEGQSTTSDWQVVGVVGDTKYENIRSEIAPMAFTPHLYRMSAFELRTKADPQAIVSVVRDIVGQVNPGFFLRRVSTQLEQINRTIYQERLVAALSAIFGGFSLTLASIGLYGLVAYGVAGRTHEIGVRMALGAQQQQILWLTARGGFVLALSGMVVGLGVATGVTRYLQSLLYHVRPSDPWTFLCIALLLTGIVALGCYIPARRAMRVDPMVALRHE